MPRYKTLGVLPIYRAARQQSLQAASRAAVHLRSMQRRWTRFRGSICSTLPRRRSSRGRSFRSIQAVLSTWSSFSSCTLLGVIWATLDLWLLPCGLAAAPPALEGAVAAPILSRLSAAAVALAEPAPFLLPAMCLLAAPSVLWICPVFAVLSLVNGTAAVLHSLLSCLNDVRSRVW